MSVAAPATDSLSGPKPGPAGAANPAAPPGPGPPAWGGCTGRVAYVAKMFPRISETFILEEILALRRHGVPFRIYSLLPPVRDAMMHPEAQALASDVEILTPQGRGQVLRSVGEIAMCFSMRPVRTAIYLARVLVSMHPVRGLRRLRSAAHLACRLREDRIAHVHAAWAHTPATVVRMACRIVGITWSMSAHAKDIHLTDPRQLARKVRAARFTVACTASHRDLLAGLEIPDADGVRRSKVSLAHHGVDAEYFSPEPGHVTADGIILSVGRLVPKKGFPVLLEAASLLERRGISFRLEIIGNGPERKNIEDLVESLGLGDRVILHGMAVRDAVLAAYRRASCFVLACQVAGDGDRDGIPNTLAEAMACGLPVVASRLPGTEEIVRDGETGLLVPPGDPMALADALERMLVSPKHAWGFGAHARAWVMEHFDGRTNTDRRARRLARTLGIERVLYVSSDRGVPVRGHKGASVHVRSVVGALVRAGVDTRIVTAREGPADGPAPAGPLIEAHSGRASRAWARALARLAWGGEPFERAVLRLIDNVWIHAAACRLHATWVPDLVYERYSLTAVAGAWLASHLRVPFVLEVNAPLADEERKFRVLRLEGIARRIERWLLRRADRVVVVSGALRNWVARHGVPDDRILVLPNAVDPFAPGSGTTATAIREQLGLEGRFVVGFCGSLKPWHGVGRLLDALALAASETPKLALLIVGDGPERAALERRAVQLEIADRVRFTGAVSHDEVPAHLEACDLLAAPYESVDGFYFSPLKLAEYLQSGRPVVASAVGEIPELVNGAPQVTLVAPGNAQLIAWEFVRHARAGRAAARPSVARTWDEVVQRILEAGEAARRARWNWRETGEATTAEEVAVAREDRAAAEVGA